MTSRRHRSPGSLPPLPPFPPDPAATALPARELLLAARAQAVNAVARHDLAARRLAWRTAQTALLGCGLFLLAGAWSEYRRPEGDRALGAQLLALGGAVAGGAAASLLWGLARQRRVSRLLHAWARVTDWLPPRPSAGGGAGADDDTLPGLPALPGTADAAADGAAVWRTTVELLRQQQFDAEGRGPWRARWDGAQRPDRLAGPRALWVATGVAGLLVGGLALLVAATGGHDTNVSGDRDPLGGAAMAAAWGGTLAVGGAVAVWKGRRLGARLQRTEGRPAAVRRAAARERPRADRRRLLPDLLARVPPGGAFDRRHRALPTPLVAAAAGLLAGGVAVLVGGLLDRGTTAPALPLTVLLLVALGGYARRPALPVLALVAAVFLFVLGHFWLAQQRVLAERGEWVTATVVERERPWGQRMTRCTLEFADGRAPDTAVCEGGAPRVGDEVRVLVDPEGAEQPSLSGASPAAATAWTAAAGAVFVGAVAAGAWRGHAARRAAARPAPPAAPGPGPSSA